MEFSMLVKYVEERTKGTEIDQPKQLFQRESIDSPSTPGSRKRSRKKAITITYQNVVQGTKMSNVPLTLGTNIYSTTSTSACASCIGTYETEVEYNVVSREIIMTDVGKVFNRRLKEPCLQCFKQNLHLLVSKIPMHLQEEVIDDMDTKFGTGWSIKKVKKQMTQNCKRFHCSQTEKLKQIPPELRAKRRLIDVSMKIWKELVKAYDRADARRESDEESIHVFKFGHKIISNSSNDLYILLVHN